MTSKRIGFEKLLNTRDLGGMTGSDGRKIRPGKLFRSGHLFSASEKDLEKISKLICLSVDFRSAQELTEKPEPEITGVTYAHIPILDERRAGVTRDEESFAEVRSNMVRDASIAKRYMIRTYRGFILNDFSVSQYARFAKLLLQDRDKGILWHCTAGKDRAGFATVIVQELLGVSREEIMKDYLMTNTYLEPETLMLTEMICAQPGIDRETAGNAVSYIFTAKPEYLDLLYSMINEHYGSFEGYLRKALRITPEEQARIQEIYLE